MIQWILVNINTAPDTGVIRPDWDNSKTWFNTREMLLPEIVGGGFADNNCLSGLLPIPARSFNFVCSIGNI
jgi:hypothetical protein